MSRFDLVTRFEYLGGFTEIPTGLKARVLASRTISLLANRFATHSTVGSGGRLYIQLTRPRAKKFFDRSASRDFVPLGFTASIVRDVMGTSYTVNASRLWSLRGSAA